MSLAEFTDFVTIFYVGLFVFAGWMIAIDGGKDE
jgi:hypothetical protein